MVQTKPFADATRRAGFRYCRSGTVDRMSNEMNIVPEAHEFYTIFTSCGVA